ncbi:ABC transporter permease [Methanocella arvoryzae]|uniref:ABC-type transport system, permease component n=1 Tax=Methanocella arvoryzae (strain DSM 22066 / NBRC 105507 / MRE50) TaxID=351160 RepID=Q0W6S2_METAR|nr:ABC transporter permease subunit [Methanocella arvoryzae]CAJ35921.1 hypothetical protein RCIX493 [Methanocella arvoryzae MRE50]
MSIILKIAKNDISVTLRQPVIIAVFIILLILAILHGWGHAALIKGYTASAVPDYDPFFEFGVQNIISPTSTYLSAVAMFIGILTVIDEKSTGVMRVMMTKPLYRKDIIAGKFLGISLLMLLLTVIFVSLFTASLLIFYGGPESSSELILRIPSYTLVLYVHLMLFLAISMLIGQIFNNVYIAIGISGLFYWAQLKASSIFVIIDKINILGYFSPRTILFKILFVDDTSMFNLLRPFDAWLSAALPWMVWSVLLIVVIFQINSLLFSRYDA